jgi:hypothetical protein
MKANMELQFGRLIADLLTRFSGLAADQIGTEMAGQLSICETLELDRSTTSELSSFLRGFRIVLRGVKLFQFKQLQSMRSSAAKYVYRELPRGQFLLRIPAINGAPAGRNSSLLSLPREVALAENHNQL